METAYTEDMKRHRLARMRFKGLVNLVIADRFWLQDIEEQIGLNYQRNVAIITRRRRKKGIITLHRARARLTPYIGYAYYGPERTIHREGNISMAMYFILDGEVTVFKKKWDFMEKKYVENVVSILGSGDCFGEISLLENRVLKVTVKTASDVELLVLEKDDFFKTIGPELLIEYNQKKMAISAMEYAKSWDFTQIYVACKLATINQYPALETIYTEDQGLLNPVYFVISGQCTILQCLKIKVKIINGRKRYRLFEEKEKENDDTDKLLPTTSVFELFQQEKDKKMKEEEQKKLLDLIKEKEMDEIEEEAFKKGRADKDNEEDHRKMLQVHKEMNVEKLKQPGGKDMTVINYCGVEIDLTPMDVGANEPIVESSHSLPVQKEASMMRTIEEYKAKYKKTVEDMEDKMEKAEPEKPENIHDDEEEEDETGTSSIPSKQESSEISENQSEENEEEASELDSETGAHRKTTIVQYAGPSAINITNKTEFLSQKSFVDIRGRSTVHFKTKVTEPKEISTARRKVEKKDESYDYIESHFVDVGTIAAGSIFGVGEDMHQRAIMAKTTVQCMLIPRYWLYEKKQNPGNLWQRLQFHLNKTIPSREALFKDFLATRRWDKHKEKIINSVVHDKKANNATKIDDIPIICRILEGMYE